MCAAGSDAEHAQHVFSSINKLIALASSVQVIYENMGAR